MFYLVGKLFDDVSFKRILIHRINSGKRIKGKTFHDSRDEVDACGDDVKQTKVS